MTDNSAARIQLSERELKIAVTALRHFMETHYNAASNPRFPAYSARFKALADEAGDLCDKIGKLAEAKHCDVRSSIGELAP